MLGRLTLLDARLAVHAMDHNAAPHGDMATDGVAGDRVAAAPVLDDQALRALNGQWRGDLDGRAALLVGLQEESGDQRGQAPAQADAGVEVFHILEFKGLHHPFCRVAFEHPGRQAQFVQRPFEQAPAQPDGLVVA